MAPPHTPHSEVTVMWPDVGRHRSDVLQNEAYREVPGPSKGVGQGHQVQKNKVF